MAPESPAAAATGATGSGSDASDAEADAARFYSRRRSSSPIPSRSLSRSPSPNLPPSAAALASTPTSAGADIAAASSADANASGRAPSPRPRDGTGLPRDRLDSDADAGAGTGRRVPYPRRCSEFSPSIHSDSDVGDREPSPRRNREPSPRRNRERTPRLHSNSDNSTATVTITVSTSSEDGDEGAGDASPSPRARLSPDIKAPSIKPIRTRPMDASGRDAAATPEARAKRRHSTSGRGTYQKRPLRFWSPEDDLTILSALIEYRAKKGRLPASIQDTGKLLNQINGQLTANATTTQLSDKVRRLKHKYKLLVRRAKNGLPDLPTEHDRSVYELSKEVWGLESLEGRSLAHEDAGDAESNEEQEINASDEDMGNGGKHRERRSKKPKTSRFENGNIAIATVGRASHGIGSGRDDGQKGKQMYPYLWAAVEELSKEHPSGPVFRKAFGVLEKSKARAIEEKLRKLRMTLIRQQLHRMDLTKESVGMVLDALEGHTEGWN